MTTVISENRNIAYLEDEAFDLQCAQGNHDMRGRFAVMTNLQKVATLFNNLDCEVCNGGFEQWIANGYGNELSLRGLRGALEGTRELNPAVHDMLTSVLDKAEPLIADFEAQGSDMSEAEWAALAAEADKLDAEYYALRDEPMAFFQSVLNGYDAQRDPFLTH